MSFRDAFIAHEDLYRAQIWADMWGYPEPHVRYPIKMLIGHSEDGTTLVLSSNIPDECANPFFWDDVTRVLLDKYEFVGGTVYWWVGYYKKFKNGNCIFSGTLSTVPIDKL